MSEDLVKRGRAIKIVTGVRANHDILGARPIERANQTIQEMADRIEGLEAANARLREALLYASAVVDSVKDCEEVDPNTLAAAIIKIDTLQEGEG